MHCCGCKEAFFFFCCSRSNIKRIFPSNHSTPSLLPVNIKTDFKILSVFLRHIWWDLSQSMHIILCAARDPQIFLRTEVKSTFAAKPGLISVDSPKCVLLMMQLRKRPSKCSKTAICVRVPVLPASLLCCSSGAAQTTVAGGLSLNVWATERIIK